MNESTSSLNKPGTPLAQLADISYREWHILLLISDDKSNSEIQELTLLKLRTIINMRYRIGEKLGMKGRDKLGQFARAHREELHDCFQIFFPRRSV